MKSIQHAFPIWHRNWHLKHTVERIITQIFPKISRKLAATGLAFWFHCLLLGETLQLLQRAYLETCLLFPFIWFDLQNCDISLQVNTFTCRLNFIDDPVVRLPSILVCHVRTNHSTVPWTFHTLGIKYIPEIFFYSQPLYLLIDILGYQALLEPAYVYFKLFWKC